MEYSYQALRVAGRGKKVPDEVRKLSVRIRLLSIKVK